MVIEIIKILAFPIVLLILGVLFLMVFKNDISNFIGRIKRLSRSEISTDVNQSQQSLKEKESKTEELLKAFDSVLLTDYEKTINEFLEKQGINDDKEKIKVLIRHLARTKIDLDFELINKFIYGSQISILNHLNSKPNGETKETLKVYYDNAISKYSELKDYTYSSYINYLIYNRLIFEKNDKMYIALQGREFLEFIVKKGYTGFRSS